MSRQQRTPGSILAINVNNTFYCYAQILSDKSSCAFFDYKSKDKITNLKLLTDANILFVVAVYNDVLTSGEWVKIGQLPIRDDLLEFPLQYIYHPNECIEYELYNPNTGEITSATKQQCLGLECCSVWDKHHVEDRLRDYYNDTPNKWLEEMKIK